MTTPAELKREVLGQLEDDAEGSDDEELKDDNEGDEEGYGDGEGSDDLETGMESEGSYGFGE